MLSCIVIGFSKIFMIFISEEVDLHDFFCRNVETIAYELVYPEKGAFQRFVNSPENRAETAPHIPWKSSEIPQKGTRERLLRAQKAKMSGKTNTKNGTAKKEGKKVRPVPSAQISLNHALVEQQGPDGLWHKYLVRAHSEKSTWARKVPWEEMRGPKEVKLPNFMLRWRKIMKHGSMMFTTMVLFNADITYVFYKNRNVVLETLIIEIFNMVLKIPKSVLKIITF